MGFFRIIALAFVALSVIYVSISFYSRAVRRDKLQRAWLEDGAQGDRDAYVREGLAEYDVSFRRRLILGVYVVPMVIVGTIVYLVNYA